MKVLLTTLNSKYIHSNLALRYLRSYCNQLPIKFDLEEYNINQNFDYIRAEIYRKKPDIIAFSCYIWNIRSILQISDSLKKVLPDTRIILGGPEVSFDSKDILLKHSYIDYIVRGEGEETFYHLLKSLMKNEEPDNLAGLTYWKGQEVVSGPERSLIFDLDIIPSPFDDNLEDLKNRLIYYESSRGCPFNCQYCLSSTFLGVRSFSMERIKQDLLRLINAEVPKVKFVDRTFNYDPERALEIMSFIVKHHKKTAFHFEIAAHLLTDDILKFLADVPEGLFQFEIGVQSTYEPTLKKIKRVDDFERLSEVVKVLSGYKNIHLHLDLIAGLPEEDYVHFQKSFNDVMSLKPGNLQLGFLKLLKGSGIRNNAEDYQYKFLTEPPYEILSNNLLSYDEILELKMVEDLLEKFYNSHKFETSVDFIISRYYSSNPYRFFKDLKDRWELMGYHHAPVKDIVLYRFLLDFYQENFSHPEIFKEYLKFDLLRNNRIGYLPEWLNTVEVEDFKDRCYQFAKDPGNLSRYVPHLSELEPRQILRKILICPFTFDILKFQDQGYNGSLDNHTSFLLFDYETTDKVQGLAKYHKINL